MISTPVNPTFVDGRTAPRTAVMDTYHWDTGRTSLQKLEYNNNNKNTPTLYNEKWGLHGNTLKSHDVNIGLWGSLQRLTKAALTSPTEVGLDHK